MEQSNSVLVEGNIINFYDDPEVLGASKVTSRIIAEAQATLGVRLPSAYVDLIQLRNGGYLVTNTFFSGEGPPDQNGFWIPFLYGLAGEEGIDSIHDGVTLNESLIRNWGYPISCVVLAHYDHGGVILDYTQNGPFGEPSVAAVNSDMHPLVTYSTLAPDFLSFVKGLRSVT